MRLILASASPRRAELLTSAGYVFEVAPAHVDETAEPDEASDVYALRVARDKARVVADRQGPGTTVLAADTVVVRGGEILGKPRNAADAERMLTLLSGAVHEVLTAVVIRTGGRELTAVETTRVRFAALTPAEIAWYIASGEPEGKAGAYAIQGLAARFIERIEGSWSNVVGLPIATVYSLLNTAQKGYSEGDFSPSESL
jgi:septum formation protein